MIYAVGDVHGESEALRELLELLPLNPADLIIFHGDLINRRGLNPFDCVQQVLEFDRCRKVCLLGNHEETLRDVLETGDITLLNGMECQNTLDSYAAAGYALTPGDPFSIPESHARFYFQAESWTLPFYITDDYIFTHAGWDLYKPLQQQSSHALHWGRVTGFEAPKWTQTVVRGHTPLPKVTFARAKHTIGVDTGCGMGGMLSAVALPTEQVFSVKPLSYNPRWYFSLGHARSRNLLTE